MNWPNVPRGAIDAATLTPSQRRLAILAAAGVSQREIAKHLHISRSTVRSHLEEAARRIQTEEPAA